MRRWVNRPLIQFSVTFSKVFSICDNDVTIRDTSTGAEAFTSATSATSSSASSYTSNKESTDNVHALRPEVKTGRSSRIRINSIYAQYTQYAKHAWYGSCNANGQQANVIQIFDPIRVLMWKQIYWTEFKVYKWLQANTLERLHPKSESLPADKQIWKEREDAERGIQAYLSDLPSTVTFVHGPQGSGKSTMIVSALKSAESMNNLIDLASVAGLSRSLGEQLQQILDSVALALRNVSEKQHKDIAKNVQTREHDKPAEQFDKAERSRNEGSQNEKGNTPEIDQKQAQESPASSTKTRKKKEKDSSEIQAVEALPIVVIRNFAGKAVREDLLNGLAQWATKLAENQIAHVIVISDNRENS
ncbi:RNA12 protein-domain-containing protein, partial [Lentinula aff. detonsa]